MKKNTHKKEIKQKKHLTLDERITIQALLENGKSPAMIANGLSKAPSTIIREISKHTIVTPAINDCELYAVCNERNICRRYRDYMCRKNCKYCKEKDCRTFCRKYLKAECLFLKKSPYLCNGCPKRETCFLERRFYKAEAANEKYKKDLTNKRAGVDLTDEQIVKLNEKVTPMIKAGQSPYAVSVALGDELPCSASSLYRYIGMGILDVRNIDLPERVMRKPRRHKRNNKDAYAIISQRKQGHLWKDYLSFYDKYGISGVQMDCVEGKRDDNAVILSLHWVHEHMQLYFIMSEHDSANVIATLDKIEEALGTELFKEMIPVILTDNGHEFADVNGIERSVFDPTQKRTTVFYCEPNRSDEKGACERNHRLLRRVIPKGTSLEGLMQWDLTLVTNHVNSYVRDSLQKSCPYDLAIDRYDEDFFVLLGLERIPKEQVVLTPDLLKKDRKTA